MYKWNALWHPGFLIALGAFLGLLVAWCISSVRQFLKRRKLRCRIRRGFQGEREAPLLLRRAGWDIIEFQPTRDLPVIVDGEPWQQPVRADYLCVRKGKTLPAEVKTGHAAALPAARRQLLEYAVAFDTGAVLLVDADSGSVHEIAFPTLADYRPKGKPRYTFLFLVGLLLGGLLGSAIILWLHSSSP